MYKDFLLININKYDSGRLCGRFCTDIFLISKIRHPGLLPYIRSVEETIFKVPAIHFPAFAPPSKIEYPCCNGIHFPSPHLGFFWFHLLLFNHQDTISRQTEGYGKLIKKGSNGMNLQPKKKNHIPQNRKQRGISLPFLTFQLQR